MSRIYVNVGAAGTLQVPSTGANTQNNTKFDSNHVIGVEAAVTAVMAVAVLFFVTLRFLKRLDGKFGLKKIGFGLMVLMMATCGLVFGLLKLTESRVQPVVADAPSDTLSITTEDIDINIMLDDQPVYEVVANTVRVNTPTDIGYTLSAYVENPRLVAESGAGAIEMAGGISGETTVLAENTWGISLVEPESQEMATWQGLPTTRETALVLKETDNATLAGDETTFYYGAHVTPELPVGVYEGGVINYFAVAKVVPEPKVTFLKTGRLINSLLNDYFWDAREIRRVETLPAEEELGGGKIELITISTPESEHPVYLVYDDRLYPKNDIVYYTEADVIYLNEDSSGMFEDLRTLRNISELSSWNTSMVKNMSWMFAHTSLFDLDALMRWDTSNVTNMSSMFSDVPLRFVNGIMSWNVSNVINMRYMFEGVYMLDAYMLDFWRLNRNVDMTGAFDCDDPPSWYDP